MAGIHERVERALKRIIQVNDSAGVQTILLCVHAATNICIGRALTGNPQVCFSFSRLR